MPNDVPFSAEFCDIDSDTRFELTTNVYHINDFSMKTYYLSAFSSPSKFMAESTSATGAHALVFGASGLAGWGVVDQLLSNYPAQGTFSRVTALVNRPFSVADSYWPSALPSQPELQLVPHVNLLKGSVEELTALLKCEVAGIGNVTHAFYFGACLIMEAHSWVHTHD